MARETRPEKVFFLSGMVVRRDSGMHVTARVSHVAPIMIILYFSPFSFLRLAFIIYASAPSSVLLCYFGCSIFSQNAFLLDYNQKLI